MGNDLCYISIDDLFGDIGEIVDFFSFFEFFLYKKENVLQRKVNLFFYKSGFV